MKREEYMGALRSALTGFDEELAQEIVADYEERFRVGMEQGKSDEQIIRELGSIKDLLDELGEMQYSGAENFHMAGIKKNAAEDVTVEDVIVEDAAPEQETGRQTSGGETETEKEKEDSYHRQSGTYYQEKGFAESFDAAMKKFGKVFDNVMKEAGKVIEEAAEQLEYHMEEAKKNRYYTYNAEGSFEGSERDSEGEPNVEQSAEGSMDCHKVIVDTDIADVKIRTTKAAAPKAVCHYYSHKTAMLYPFYARQEGDTFYVSIRRKQDGEKKSGFFQFNTSPSIEVELFLPGNLWQLKAENISGNMELDEISAEDIALRTKSGNITANYLTSDKVHMEAVSGNITLAKTRAKEVVMASKSGNGRADQLEGESFSIHTISGNAELKNIKGTDAVISTASGDISMDALYETTAKVHTASGEIRIVDYHGDILETCSASGDIEIKADCDNYNLKSQSGDVRLENRKDANVTANSASGDVEIRILEALETYQVTMHSISGTCATYGETKSGSNVPTRTMEVKTISGDAAIRFS